jgi:hypothetical protein
MCLISAKNESKKISCKSTFKAFLGDMPPLTLYVHLGYSEKYIFGKIRSEYIDKMRL